MPTLKRYRDELDGLALGDLWTDIDRINPRATERLGFPNQKPLALLERIITASSRPGQVVLDPFCGSGTTLAAAELLGRSWIGIDVWSQAVNVTQARLRTEGIEMQIITDGDAPDAESAAEGPKSPRL